MENGTRMNKFPMPENEAEKVKQEFRKLRLVYIYSTIPVFLFIVAIVFGSINRTFPVVVMAAVFLAVFAAAGIKFRSKYIHLKIDMREKMMYSESGVLDDISVSFGNGPQYIYFVNGQTGTGTKEMHDTLKKGDRIELYFAYHSKILVGFKKVS
jgi:hypothetical protein